MTITKMINVQTTYVTVKSKLNIFLQILITKRSTLVVQQIPMINPLYYECNKCKIIFSELIFKIDKNQIEKSYQDIADDKYISQIKFKNIILKNYQ